MIPFPNKIKYLQSILKKNLILFVSLSLFLLFACESENTRELESRGIKIKILAYSDKDAPDVGVAVGGAHAVVVVPYIKSGSNSWHLSLVAEGFDTLFMESGSEYYTKKELERMLSGIRVSFSPDTHHLCYRRHSTDGVLIKYIHFFGNRQGIVCDTPSVYDEQKPVWKNMPEAFDLAKKMIGGKINIYSSWDFLSALISQKPENELDFLSLEILQKENYAFDLIKQRNLLWKNRSQKWKTAFRKKIARLFADPDQLTKKINNQQLNGSTAERLYDLISDEFLKDNIQNLIIEMRDPPTDWIYLEYLTRNALKEEPDEYMRKFFQDSLRKEMRPVFTAWLEKKCDSVLKNDTETSVLKKVYDISVASDNKQLQKKLEKNLLDLWPDNVESAEFVLANFLQFDANQRSAIFARAEKEAIQKNSETAIQFLIQYSDCKEMTWLKKKIPDEITLDYECRPERGEYAQKSYVEKK